MKLRYRGSGKVYIGKEDYRCDLYYSEKQGGIILKINIKNENSLGSFLKVPLEISCLHGMLESGFKFSLLNLKRMSMEDLVSYGITIYTYEAEYIFSGIARETEQTFHKVNYTLSNIVEWGEESIYSVGEHFELIHKKEDVRKCIYQGCGFSISYCVYGSILPVVEQELLKEHINLDQQGIIEIVFDEEKTYGAFNAVFEKLKRLIEIASFRRINVEAVTAYSNSITYTVGDRAITQPIRIYGKDIKKCKYSEYSQRNRWKWISMSELITHNSFAQYFEKHNKLAPIIELFLEPFHGENNSETRVFLNIVQALETYHSRFFTNSIEDFKARVDGLLSKCPQARVNEVREFLMAHSKKFITLESRIAELLLANWGIHFDTGEIKHREFPSVVAHTRNYYIHYDEGIKEQYKVFTEEELEIYNRALLQILEYYILLELGFSETIEIKKKLRERWGNISQEFEILRMSRAQQ